jgi:CBS domain containing-hemolysin-like protein
MIRGVIGLSDQNVREIMIPRIDVVALDVDAGIREVVETIYGAGHSRIPVYKDTIDHIVGILHVKDLLKYVIDRPKKFTLKKILRKPYFVPETMTSTTCWWSSRSAASTWPSPWTSTAASAAS